jgi:hypothetical protein
MTEVAARLVPVENDPREKLAAIPGSSSIAVEITTRERSRAMKLLLALMMVMLPVAAARADQAADEAAIRDIQCAGTTLGIATMLMQ